MGVREERRSAAREGILAAAHRQVAEAGLASASVATVAARAGVATGSLYRHFPSRGELLAAVVGDALRGEQALLDKAAEAEDDPGAALESWIRTMVTRSRQAPTLTRALLEEPGGPEVDVARGEARRRRDGALEALIAAGAGAGAWPGGTEALRAAAILGACQAAAALPRGERHPAAEQEQGRADGSELAAGVEAEASELTAFCLAGLHARAG